MSRSARWKEERIYLEQLKQKHTETLPNSWLDTSQNSTRLSEASSPRCNIR